MCGILLPNAYLPDGFCAHILPLKNNNVVISKPRSLIAVGTSNLLVLERGYHRITWIYDSDDDGWADDATVLVRVHGLNHGLAYYNNYIYASSDTHVYRWRYELGSDQIGEEEGQGRGEEVIVNMNSDGQGGAPGGHTTRTLIFDSTGKLYVSIGSAGNVDHDSYRARIRRFDISDNANLPVQFADGEVFADGLRNEVGLAFDKHGVFWGVENGADNLVRDDLGGDIHEDNPAEELNRFPEEHAGRHWGYPYCWSEYYIPADDGGRGINTRWKWPSFSDKTDEFCRTETMSSELAMQAHSAPLGIAFYNYTASNETPDVCTGAFPKELDGFAFIAFHGSWNRDEPTGYKVVYVPMNEDGRVLHGEEPTDLLRHGGTSAKWPNGLRPVDVDFDECGRLLVTTDGPSSEIIRISYNKTILQPLNNDNETTISNVCCGEVQSGFTTGTDIAMMPNQATTAAICFIVGMLTFYF